MTFSTQGHAGFQEYDPELVKLSPADIDLVFTELELSTIDVDDRELADYITDWLLTDL